MAYCQFCGAGLQSQGSQALDASGATVSESGSDRPPSWNADAERARPASARTGQFAPMATAAVNTAARLVTIARDGAEGTAYPLAGTQLDIGREEGAILLREDPYVSPRHLRLFQRGGSWYARDLDSLNGFFVRLLAPHRLMDGDLLLIGLQVLKFEPVKDAEQGFGPASQQGTLLFGSPLLPRFARLTERTVEGISRNTFYLHREETIIGREAGDIVFTDDPFMSRRHLAIRFDASKAEFSAADLGSSNGTYVAVRGEVLLSDGDYIRMGQHLFRFDSASSRAGRMPSGGARRPS